MGTTPALSEGWGSGYNPCFIWRLELWIQPLLYLKAGVVGTTPALSEGWGSGYNPCFIWRLELWVQPLLYLKAGVVDTTPALSEGWSCGYNPCFIWRLELWVQDLFHLEGMFCNLKNKIRSGENRMILKKTIGWKITWFSDLWCTKYCILCCI